MRRIDREAEATIRDAEDQLLRVAGALMKLAPELREQMTAAILAAADATDRMSEPTAKARVAQVIPKAPRSRVAHK